MFRGFLSLIFIFTILASFVSENFEKKSVQISSQQDPNVEMYTEVINSVAFYEKSGCDQCCRQDCQREKGCCLNFCSCIPHFTIAYSEIAFVKKEAFREKTRWFFSQFYKSHSINPELQPPRFS